MTDKEKKRNPGPADHGVDQWLAPTGSRSRRRFLHLTLILLVAVPTVVWLLGSVGEDDEIPLPGREVGAMAPDFALTLFDGTSFALNRHLAEDRRPVVLNFWASWCVPCREEMPAFDAVARRRAEIFFLGVAVQDAEPAARVFAEEVRVSYALGHDADGAILKEYPILGLPATWFITADGALAEQWFGQLDENRLEGLIDQHLSG